MAHPQRVAHARRLPIILAKVRAAHPPKINAFVGPYTSVWDHYQAPVQAPYVVRDAWDDAYTVNGQPLHMVESATAELVDTNPNTFYQANGILYIRTTDDRMPDADIRLYATSYT